MPTLELARPQLKKEGARFALRSLFAFFVLVTSNRDNADKEFCQRDMYIRSDEARQILLLLLTLVLH
jgi:hypothetical protein